MKAYRAGYIPDLCGDYAAETRAKAAGMAIKGLADAGYLESGSLRSFRCIRVPERDAEAALMTKPGWLDVYTACTPCAPETPDAASAADQPD